MVVNRGQVTLNLRKSTMDQLASMRIFLAVAEANALNGAARQLGLSPSAVSKHVAALENQLVDRGRTKRKKAPCVGALILFPKVPYNHS